jgi:hypothetical protein
MEHGQLINKEKVLENRGAGFYNSGQKLLKFLAEKNTVLIFKGPG